MRILAGRPTPASITMNKIIICIDNELWTMEEEEDLLRIIIVQQWKCKSFFLYLPFRYWNLMHFSYFKDSIDKTEFGEKWRCDQAGSFWMRESNYARGGWRSTHAQIVNDFKQSRYGRITQVNLNFRAKNNCQNVNKQLSKRKQTAVINVNKHLLKL